MANQGSQYWTGICISVIIQEINICPIRDAKIKSLNGTECYIFLCIFWNLLSWNLKAQIKGIKLLCNRQ